MKPNFSNQLKLYNSSSAAFNSKTSYQPLFKQNITKKETLAYSTISALQPDSVSRLPNQSPPVTGFVPVRSVSAAGELELAQHSDKKPPQMQFKLSNQISAFLNKSSALLSRANCNPDLIISDKFRRHSFAEAPKRPSEDVPMRQEPRRSFCVR